MWGETPHTPLSLRKKMTKFLVCGGGETPHPPCSKKIYIPVISFMILKCNFLGINVGETPIPPMYLKYEFNLVRINVGGNPPCILNKNLIW